MDKKHSFQQLEQDIAGLTVRIIQLREESKEFTRLSEQCMAEHDRLTELLQLNINSYNEQLQSDLTEADRSDDFDTFKIPTIFRSGNILLETDEAGDLWVQALPDLKELSPES